MKVSKEEILHIANLASIKIKDEEIDKYVENLEEILNKPFITHHSQNIVHHSEPFEHYSGYSNVCYVCVMTGDDAHRAEFSRFYLNKI